MLYPFLFCFSPCALHECETVFCFACLSLGPKCGGNKRNVVLQMHIVRQLLTTMSKMIKAYQSDSKLQVLSRFVSHLLQLHYAAFFA